MDALRVPWIERITMANNVDFMVNHLNALFMSLLEKQAKSAYLSGEHKSCQIILTI